MFNNGLILKSISRRWDVSSWVDVSGVSAGVREFFDNTDEFISEEAEVYGILECGFSGGLMVNLGLGVRGFPT